MSSIKVSDILKQAYFYDNWSGKVFLECGAGPHGNETAEFEINNFCYYLEPVDEYYKILSSIKNKDNIFNLGLSNFTGECEFTETSHLGNGSITHSNDHIAELKSYNSTFKKIKIQTITYFDFCKLINKNIDILVLDVEGHEVAILNTLLSLSNQQKPKIIVIECGYDWKDRLNILKQLGYNLDFFYYNNAYLTLKECNIIKNVNCISIFRNQWRKWIYNNKLIYDDTDLQTISS